MKDITKDWSKAQLQAFLNYCWIGNWNCNPANAKKFMQTKDFKTAA